MIFSVTCFYLIVLFLKPLQILLFLYTYLLSILFCIIYTLLVFMLHDPRSLRVHIVRKPHTFSPEKIDQACNHLVSFMNHHFEEAPKARLAQKNIFKLSTKELKSLYYSKFEIKSSHPRQFTPQKIPRTAPEFSMARPKARSCKLNNRADRVYPVDSKPSHPQVTSLQQARAKYKSLKTIHSKTHGRNSEEQKKYKPLADPVVYQNPRLKSILDKVSTGGYKKENGLKLSIPYEYNNITDYIPIETREDMRKMVVEWKKEAVEEGLISADERQWNQFWTKNGIFSVIDFRFLHNRQRPQFQNHLKNCIKPKNSLLKLKL